MSFVGFFLDSSSQREVLYESVRVFRIGKSFRWISGRLGKGSVINSPMRFKTIRGVYECMVLQEMSNATSDETMAIYFVSELYCAGV